VSLDKIFKAYDVRATYPDMLNEASAWKIGYAAGQLLGDEGKQAQDLDRPNTLLVSRDMRTHSEPLAEQLILGLRAAGVDVIDLGMCDTSIQYFAVNHLGSAGGIQVTASHNPPQYNGFKISRAGARPVGAQTGLLEIQKLALAAPEPGSVEPAGAVTSMDLWNEYRAHILRFHEPPTAGRSFKAFIDAANGMGGKLVPQVFEGLAGLEILPLNFEITGSFAHEPNPLKAENMVPTQEGVKQHGADLGVSFDGDADRCMLTDDRGRIIGCDHLTALMAGYFLQHHPGATVVYDLRSSKVVEETILKLGGKPHRSRVGHVFMKAALRETGAIFGGELSGHFYFRDNFNADSGAITLAVVLSIMGRADAAISELVAPFRQYPQSGELNFEAADKLAVIDSLKQQYGDARIDELDGVTIDYWGSKGWWINVRPSNTEPLLRLNAEAKDDATLKALLAEITPRLGTPETGH